jgi:molybdopterin converting factor small subunit
VRVRVYAPAYADHGALDEKGFLELPEGAKLRDVYRALKLRPLARIFCLLNYERAKSGVPLKDGDVVSFFSVVGGG